MVLEVYQYFADNQVTIGDAKALALADFCDYQFIIAYHGVYPGERSMSRRKREEKRYDELAYDKGLEYLFSEMQILIFGKEKAATSKEYQIFYDEKIVELLEHVQLFLERSIEYKMIQREIKRSMVMIPGYQEAYDSIEIFCTRLRSSVQEWSKEQFDDYLSTSPTDIEIDKDYYGWNIAMLTLRYLQETILAGKFASSPE